MLNKGLQFLIPLHLHTSVVQILGDEVLQRAGRGGGDLARLHDHGVAGGEGGQHGGQRQQQREVPGADHEDAAVGLRVDVDAVKQGQGALVTHPGGK